MGFWGKLGQALEEAGRFGMIADRMKRSSGVECDFRIVHFIHGESRQAAAYAGSNEIRITKEVVDMLDDNELAWILGHELAHLKFEHGQAQSDHTEHLTDKLVDLVSGDHRRRKRRGQDSILRNAQTALMGAAGLAVVAASAAGKSQLHESHADMAASNFCRWAGFDPRAGAAVLQKLYDHDLPRQGILGRVFSSHPDPEARINAILQRW